MVPWLPFVMVPLLVLGTGAGVGASVALGGGAPGLAASGFGALRPARQPVTLHNFPRYTHKGNTLLILI